MKIWI